MSGIFKPLTPALQGFSSGWWDTETDDDWTHGGGDDWNWTWTD